MAFTKLYLTANAAPYSPATIRGAWDDTAGAVTKRLDTTGNGGGATTSVARSESSTTDEYDVLLYRGVSGPLGTQELDVNLNVCIAVTEDSSAQNAHWHIHAYTTQGDSDTVRETAVNDYREAAGTNEWGADHVGMALNAVVSCHIHCQDGDRLVVEIGYTSRNTSASTYTGRLYYGSEHPDTYQTLPDMVVGYDRRYYAGILTFSASVAEGTITSRVSQGPVETLLTVTGVAGRVSQGPVEVLMVTSSDAQRVSQIVAELLKPAVVATRVSQIVAEALTPTVVETRTTHLVAELLDAGVHPVRVSQIVVELLGKQSNYCGIPFLTPTALCGKPDVLAWLEWTVPTKEN
jgi:hypothetical protein